MLWIYLVRSKLYEFKQVSIALEWLHDLGADEIINETPFNRFEIDSEDALRRDSFNQRGTKEEILSKTYWEKLVVWRLVLGRGNGF